MLNTPLILRLGLGLGLGWLAGGLVNYLSDVLPTRRRLVRPFCQKCQAGLGWLTPWWPQVCPACGAPPNLRSWLTLAAFLALGAWMLAAPPARLGPWIGLLWLVYFGVIIVIDVEHHLILHPVSLVGAVLALAVGWQRHGLVPTLIGGAFGFGLMWGAYILGVLFARWLKRRRGEAFDEDEALGFGDVTLSGVIGLLLGWPGIGAGLVLAVLLGGGASLIYLAFMAVQGKSRLALAVPYGPFLALATILLLYVFK